MSDDLATRLERFAHGQYRPTTFLERGVVVPFTTPLLLGARLRPSERHGLETVIANLSGGRGFYVVSWQSLPEICAPTLHDERLWSVLAGQPLVTPAAVREAAHQVALTGYAGRAAAAAAVAAARRGPVDCLDTVYMLLMRLIRQTETPEETRAAVAHDSPAQREARGRRAIQRIAPAIGASPAVVGDWLAGLAAVLQEVGAPHEPRPARARQRIAAMEAMMREVSAWAAVTPAARELGVGHLICEVADLTLQCCHRITGQVDALLADMRHLLQSWRHDAEALRTLVSRIDWLLDGWPLICSLWQAARGEARLAASWEMAMLVPVLPREAEDWCGLRADWDRPLRLRRAVRMGEDWRTGHFHDLVARGERLLVRAA